MGISERKQRQREQVKNSILETAQGIACQEGWQAVSMRRIADVIEYSAPVIYEHFENKEAILLELKQKGFRLLTEKILTARSEHEAPEDQIMAIAKAYWNFAFENVALYQVMFNLGGVACKGQEGGADAKVHIRNGATVMTDAIRALLVKKGRTEEDLSLKLDAFWALKHGLISLTLVGKIKGGKERAEKVLEEATIAFIQAW